MSTNQQSFDQSSHGVFLASSHRVRGVGVSGPRSLWAFDSDGTPKWHFDSGHTLYAVIVLSDGNVACCGYPVAGKSVWILDPDDGSVVRSWLHDSTYYSAGSLAEDSSGNIYACTFNVPGTSISFLRKYSSLGSLVASLPSADFWFSKIIIDSADSVYGANANRFTALQKRNTSLVLSWQVSFGDTPYNPAIAATDLAKGSSLVYVVGDPTQDAIVLGQPFYDLRAYTTAGALSWRKKIGDEAWMVYGLQKAVLRGVAVGDGGNLYLGAAVARFPASIPDPYSIAKTNSTGTVTWKYDTGGRCGRLKWKSGIVLASGARTSNKSIWGLDESGALIWSHDTGNDTHDVAIGADGDFYVAGARYIPA